MIQIDRHIEVLLLDNDCVIVPDLGGFMAYHVPARYVKETGQFIPPTRQLGFNSQLKINDSLLAQSYIEAYDISYPEALRRIEAEVEEMRQMIQNTGVCELNDIGVLRINNHGSIEFEPCEAGILTPFLYGLNTLDMIPLSHIEVNKKSVIEVAKASQPKVEEKHTAEVKKTSIAQTPIVPAPIDIVANDDDDITDNDSLDSDENIETNGHSPVFSIVKHVAAVAAVIVALFVIAVPFGFPTQQMSRSYLDSGFLYNLFIDKPANHEVVVKPVEKKTVRPVVKNVSVAAKKVQEVVDTPKVEKNADVKAEVKKEADNGGTYYSIVLASCITHANAERVVKELAKSGYNEGSVVDRSNGSKVIYGHYMSEIEAHQLLRSLRAKNEVFESGWIMEFN